MSQPSDVEKVDNEVEPEDVHPVDHADLVEREADVVDPLERPVPDEANEADVVEQRQDVPAAEPEDEPEL